MSDFILRAVLRLFAAMIYSEGTKQAEIEKVKQLLLKSLNERLVNTYFNYFQKSLEKISKSNPDKKAIEELVDNYSKSLLKESSIGQRHILILELSQLILADGEIGEFEMALLRKISQNLNIAPKDFELLIEFHQFDQYNPKNEVHYLTFIRDSENDNYKIGQTNTNARINKVIILGLPHSGRLFMKYKGKDTVYINNSPAKQQSIYAILPGTKINSDLSNRSIYYNEIIQYFHKGQKLPPLTFNATQVNYQFQNGKYGLHDIDISEKEGQLIGIMGASGSGKTTLLNVLNGNLRPSEGKVTINDFDIHQDKEAAKGLMGYVPQDDLLFDKLTVYENLYFAAKLSLDHFDEIELKRKVNKTLNDLGLFGVRNLKVGNPLQKTISGGQRKRLNIALEIIREPPVLFLDEPTSGLSSRDSENIIDLLNELATKGLLIFVVIHQPSSEIFKSFDKLFILDVGGFPVYYGAPLEALDYMRQQLQLVDNTESICDRCGNVNPEKIFDILDDHIVDEHGNPTRDRKKSPEWWFAKYKETHIVSRIKNVSKKISAQFKTPRFFNQVKIFSKRDLLTKIYNTQYLTINLLEAPVLALVLAMLIRYYPGDGFNPSNYTLQENINLPTYIFMAVIVAIFMGMVVSAEEIIKDRKVLQREKFLHLSRNAYLLSKIGILFLISAIQTLAFVLVGNFLIEIHGFYLSYWLVLFSCACFANLLGLNISSAFDSVVTIYILVPLMLIPQILLSGAVVPFDKLNPSFTSRTQVPVVGNIMASRWALEALMVNQFKNNRFEKVFFELDKDAANASFKSVYLIPELKSKLETALLSHTKKAKVDEEKYKKGFELIRHEIMEELEVIGVDKFPEINNLYLHKFDSTTYRETMKFLNQLSRYYNKRLGTIQNQKVELIGYYSEQIWPGEKFVEMKKRHTNDRLSNMVKNTSNKHRIIEENNEFYQRINIIYMNPDPKHTLDFNGPFYLSRKYFLGYYFDTLYFNIAIIWIMTFLLYITLYFEVLRKIVNRKY